MIPAVFLISLTPQDQKNVATIMSLVEGVSTPSQALLWAAQMVAEVARNNPPSGNTPPPDTPPSGGKGYLSNIFEVPPIPGRPGNLSVIDLIDIIDAQDRVPALEFRLDDLLSRGISPRVTVDAVDLVKLGVKPTQVREMFSSATRGRKLSGGVEIMRVSGGSLKK